MSRRLLLASRGIPALEGHLQARGRRALLVPTAANELAEPWIADEVEQELTGAGLSVERIDLDGETAGAVRAAVLAADVVAVSGGDPFHLLAATRRTAFGEAAAAALAAGAVYVGYSAGAIVAGPTLEPVRLTTPFTPPPELELAGLGLTDVLVLPHDNRRGRAERNAAARAAFGGDIRIVTLRDREFVIQDGDRVDLHRSAHLRLTISAGSIARRHLLSARSDPVAPFSRRGRLVRPRALRHPTRDDPHRPASRRALRAHDRAARERREARSAMSSSS